MVSSVSNIPYFSYLNQLQGGTNVSSAAASVPSTSTPQTPAEARDTSSSLVSGLLGNGGFAPSILSLLQENGSANFDPLASLLNAPRTNTGAAKLYSNIYDSSAAASIQQSKNENPKVVSTTLKLSNSQSFIADATKASVAYSQTIAQNAAAAVAASKVRTDSILSVVS